MKGTLAFRLSELAEQDVGGPKKVDARARKDAATNRPKSNIPLSFFDYSTGLGRGSFLWNIDQNDSNGWNEGYWFGNGESFGWWAHEGPLIPFRAAGSQVISYTRSGTTTRRNSDGNLETVAANVMPFDHMEGPNEIDRFCPRFDLSAAIASFQSDRNIYRREGAITAWVNLSSWNTGSHVKNVFGDNSLALSMSVTTATARIRDLNNLAISTDYIIPTLDDDSWHLMGMAWSYPQSKLSIWFDGEIKNGTTAGALPLRPKEINDTLGIGCNYEAPTTTYLDGYLVDFRVWPFYMTETLFDFLYQVKA